MEWNTTESKSKRVDTGSMLLRMCFPFIATYVECPKGQCDTVCNTIAYTYKLFRNHFGTCK